MALHSHHYFEDKAEQLLQELKINTLPVDVYDVARKLGIEIMELSEPEWFSGLLLTIEDGYYIIVNKIMTPEKKRFTIAHELGHYALHKNEVCYMDNDAQEHLQRQANIFAAALIMPKTKVRAESDKWFKNHKFLAKIFGVLEDTMYDRMKEVAIFKKERDPWEVVRL